MLSTKLALFLCMILGLFWVGTCSIALGQHGHITSARNDAIEKVMTISDDLAFAWDKMLRDREPVQSRPRFIGFVDGRLGATPPDWWEKLVLEMESRITTPSFDRKGAWIYPSKFESINSSGNIEIAVDGKSFEASICKSVLLKNAKSMNGFPVDIVSAMILSDAAFLILASHNPTHAELVKIDIVSRNEIWRAKLKGDSTGLNYQGRAFHFVQPSKDRLGNIVIFGGTPHCIYLEAFSNQNGQSLYRFDSK